MRGQGEARAQLVEFLFLLGKLFAQIGLPLAEVALARLLTFLALTRVLTVFAFLAFADFATLLRVLLATLLLALAGLLRLTFL